jgi:hypothetical protein
MIGYANTAERMEAMFRLWGIIMSGTHRIQDMVVCDDSDSNRTKKVFDAIEKICYAFDLSQPIWLDSNIADFKKHAKVRFRKENFIDAIEFDYLEIQVIEEDA